MTNAHAQITVYSEQKNWQGRSLLIEPHEILFVHKLSHRYVLFWSCWHLLPRLQWAMLFYPCSVWINWLRLPNLFDSFDNIPQKSYLLILCLQQKLFCGYPESHFAKLPSPPKNVQIKIRQTNKKSTFKFKIISNRNYLWVSLIANFSFNVFRRLNFKLRHTQFQKCLKRLTTRNQWEMFDLVLGE